MYSAIQKGNSQNIPRKRCEETLTHTFIPALVNLALASGPRILTG